MKDFCHQAGSGEKECIYGAIRDVMQRVGQREVLPTLRDGLPAAIGGKDVGMPLVQLTSTTTGQVLNAYVASATGLPSRSNSTRIEPCPFNSPASSGEIRVLITAFSPPRQTFFVNVATNG